MAKIKMPKAKEQKAKRVPLGLDGRLKKHELIYSALCIDLTKDYAQNSAFGKSKPIKKQIQRELHYINRLRRKLKMENTTGTEIFRRVRGCDQPQPLETAVA